MPAVSTAAFARQLRSLDDAELAAFVADLWAARGFETALEGTLVTAERPSGVDRERIQCGASAPGTEATVDTVIDLSSSQSADRESIRVIGPADLRGMLLYAIDRETADQLLREHVGRPLPTQSEDLPLRDRLPVSPSRALLAAGLIIVLATSLALGASNGVLPFDDASQSMPATPVPPEQPASPASDPPVQTPTARTDEAPPRAGGDLFRYPPGVVPAGVGDADRIAAAHRTALDASSWALRLNHSGTLDLLHPYRQWITSRQRIVRENHTHYEYLVTGQVPAANGTLIPETYTDYGDGTANYRRLVSLHGHAFKRTQLPTEDKPGVFAAVSAAYVKRYLATTETEVEPVDGSNSPNRRVIATGTPTTMARTVTNYTAVAIIDRNGVVHHLTVEYTLLERVPEPTPNGIATPYESDDVVPTEPVRTVRFEMELTGLGETDLTAPGWYETARNATNTTDPPPWPNDPAV